MLLFAIALSPGVALVWFLRARTDQPGERLALLGALFLLGGLAAGPALVLNHAIEKYTVLWPGAGQLAHRVGFWMLGPGLNEEVIKLAVLLAVIWPRRAPLSPYQGLVCAASVAVGFAVVENLFYLERFGTATLFTRSLLTVPAHAFFTIPLGVLMGYARGTARSREKFALLLAGLVFAAVTHGLYDVLLSLPGMWVNRLAYIQILTMGLVTLWALPRIPQGAPTAEASP